MINDKRLVLIIKPISQIRLTPLSTQIKTLHMFSKWPSFWNSRQMIKQQNNRQIDRQIDRQTGIQIRKRWSNRIIGLALICWGRSTATSNICCQSSFCFLCETLPLGPKHFSHCPLVQQGSPGSTQGRNILLFNKVGKDEKRNFERKSQNVL